MFAKPYKIGTSAWRSKGGSLFSKKQKPFLKKLEKLLADRIYLENIGFQSALSIGKQTVTELSNEYHQQDINSIVIGNSHKVLLKTCQTKIIITNNVNVTVFITLYDWVARRDMNVAKTPIDYWKDSPASSAATTDVTVFGTSPFDSDLFTSFFKILKVTHIYLGAGESVEHVKYHSPNRNWDAAIHTYAVGGATGGQMFKGLSCGTFMVSHGQPAGDDADTDVTLIGATTDALFHVIAKKYTYTPIENSQHAMDVSGNNLVTAYTGGQEVMETDGDATLGLVAGQ